MNKDTSGPAFPSTDLHNDPLHGLHEVFNQGMTLRDYFAAKAMAALIANNWPIHGGAKNAIANVSYEMADAMLEERAK